MEWDGTKLASAIGGRVRAGRLARRWTLDEMAEHSGVSRRMIVKVEKGETNPSVAILLSLGDALGIGLPSLVADRDGTPTALTRHGEGVTLWTSPGGGTGILLGGTPAPDVLALWQWTLMLGDVHESDAHSLGTREILHVVGGTVTLGMSAERLELGAGDTIAFAGDQPHSYANAGIETATFTLTVSEPGVGITSSGSQHG
jgi:DNA-binding XRE family transcriptional regulator/quercetin dioxygenase-like cupin family protein